MANKKNNRTKKSNKKTAPKKSAARGKSNKAAKRSTTKGKVHKTRRDTKGLLAEVFDAGKPAKMSAKTFARLEANLRDLNKQYRLALKAGKNTQKIREESAAIRQKLGIAKYSSVRGSK